MQILEEFTITTTKDKMTDMVSWLYNCFDESQYECDVDFPQPTEFFGSSVYSTAKCYQQSQNPKMNLSFKDNAALHLFNLIWLKNSDYRILRQVYLGFA